MKIDVCLSPALFPLYNTENKSIIVVVDIFRATTSMCVAFESGVHSIRPIADIEVAKRLKSEGFLVGAERNVAKCDFADFGNSPFDYRQEKLKSQDIVMTTTNGTKAIEVASQNNELVIGSFSNFDVLVDFCSQQRQDILVLCSGWNDHLNLEDSLFAGALCESLSSKGFSLQSDAALMATALWKQAKHNPKDFLSQSEHVQRLLKFNLENDIDFCLTKNTSKVLPRFDKKNGVLLLLKKKISEV